MFPWALGTRCPLRLRLAGTLGWMRRASLGVISFRSPPPTAHGMTGLQ